MVNGFVIAEVIPLAQHPHRHASGADHAALVRLKRAGKQGEKGGLAVSVSPDNANASVFVNA